MALCPSSLFGRRCLEPGLCWACFKPAGPGAHAKMSWRTQADFIDHWYSCHANPLHKRWTYLARDVNLSPNELAIACLGVSLDTCPLPSTTEGLKCVPRGLPKKSKGHNQLVFGPPWFCGIRGRFDAGRRPLPPPGPPPSHPEKWSSESTSLSPRWWGSRWFVI